MIFTNIKIIKSGNLSLLGKFVVIEISRFLLSGLSFISCCIGTYLVYFQSGLIHHPNLHLLQIPFEKEKKTVKEKNHKITL